MSQNGTSSHMTHPPHPSPPQPPPPPLSVPQSQSDDSSPNSYLRYPPPAVSAVLSIILLASFALIFIVAFVRALIAWYSQRRNPSREPQERQQQRAATAAAATNAPPTGLDPAIIESFPVKPYGDETSQEAADQGEGTQHGRECPVCLAEYETGEPLTVLPTCRHYFHATCIQAWLSAKTTCPLCRTDLRPKTSISEREGGGSQRFLRLFFLSTPSQSRRFELSQQDIAGAGAAATTAAGASTSGGQELEDRRLEEGVGRRFRESVFLPLPGGPPGAEEEGASVVPRSSSSPGPLTSASLSASGRRSVGSSSSRRLELVGLPEVSSPEAAALVGQDRREVRIVVQ